jgi:hypothetical protein
VVKTAGFAPGGGFRRKSDLRGPPVRKWCSAVALSMALSGIKKFLAARGLEVVILCLRRGRLFCRFLSLGHSFQVAAAREAPRRSRCAGCPLSATASLALAWGCVEIAVVGLALPGCATNSPRGNGDLRVARWPLGVLHLVANMGAEVEVEPHTDEGAPHSS